MIIPVVAFYWTGGAPVQRPAKNVSAEGAYLVTDETWYEGTVLSLTFQYDPYNLQVANIEGKPDASVYMRGRVIRRGKDGVGLKFVYLNNEERRQFEQFLSGAHVRGTS